jgi:lipid A 4'-phosphatase
MSKAKRIILDVTIPLSILVGLTLLLSLTNADMALERLFYTPARGWLWKNAHPWDYLYHYGFIPPVVLSVFGLLMLLLSFLSSGVRRYRRVGLFLVLFMVLGPGLLVNTVLKDHWGRPRPAEIRNFGGTRNYLPVWERGVAGQDKSFPSGHAAVGFFMFAPFFFLRNREKRWGWSFLWLGLLYGSLMGVGRMVQGGHFASDVLWAGGLTYLTGLILCYLFRLDQ